VHRDLHRRAGALVAIAWVAVGAGCARDWDAFERVDAGQNVLCSGQDALCETFDNGTWGPAWVEVADKSLVVDTTDAISPPGALHAQCKSGCAMARDEIQNTIERPAGMNTLTCRAELRLDSFDCAGRSSLDAFGLDIRSCPQCDFTTQISLNEDGSAGLHNFVSNGGMMGGANNDFPLTTPFSRGAWHEVEVQANYGAANTTATIKVDGAIGITQLLDQAPGAIPVTVIVGVSYSNTGENNATWEMHIDDVVCDWTP
jgi:hypothetical protein